MKKKLIPLLLSLAMLAACLSGCGSTAKVEITESPAPTEAPSAAQDTPAAEAPASAEAPEETMDPEEAARMARYQAAYEKYEPDRTVLLVNGEPVTWSQYYSWIYDIASQMETAYEITDWNEARDELADVVSDASFGSFVCGTALSYVTQIEIIRQKAAELGVTLTEAQRDEINATIDGYAENLGGQEALEQLLADNYITMDYFREQNEAMLLINSLYEKLYGEEGKNLSDEDAVAYMKDNSYLYAKHILFRTVDDSNEPIPEEEAAQKKAEAEEVMAQLRAAEPDELATLFDSLMKQYSEDTGLLSYPDGYYFLSGEMVPEFEKAATALEENGLSDIVETSYGYHILFRPPMSGDHIMGYDSNYTPYTIRAFVSSALFDNVAGEWYDEAERTALYVNGFEDLDLNELFGVG